MFSGTQSFRGRKEGPELLRPGPGCVSDTLLKLTNLPSPRLSRPLRAREPPGEPLPPLLYWELRQGRRPRPSPRCTSTGDTSPRIRPGFQGPSCGPRPPPLRSTLLPPVVIHKEWHRTDPPFSPAFPSGLFTLGLYPLAGY